MLSRLRFAILCSFLLLVAAFGSGETIRFDPPNPTGSRSVDVIIDGVWPNACLPRVDSVIIRQDTIELFLDGRVPAGALCAQSNGPYTRTFHVGILPPGGYTVGLLDETGTTFKELARAPLIVRDAETMTLFPYAVPTTGGQIGVVFPDLGPEWLRYRDAPPHPPGAVDITHGGVTSKAALIYYDPAAADPAVFEPILFPVSFEGPGALGSQWQTENLIYEDGPTPAFFRDPPCFHCPLWVQAGSTRLVNDGNPWGHVLYAMRGTTAFLNFSSRIRDTSRQSETAGIEVPIVREGDFRRGGQLRFLNVPANTRYRVTLRLWTLGDYPQFIVHPHPSPQQSMTVSRIPGTSMWFGTMDLSPLLTGPIDPTMVTVTRSSNQLVPPPMWGMLSITNNETQQVTLITTH